MFSMFTYGSNALNHRRSRAISACPIAAIRSGQTDLGGNGTLFAPPGLGAAAAFLGGRFSLAASIATLIHRTVIILVIAARRSAIRALAGLGVSRALAGRCNRITRGDVDLYAVLFAIIIRSGTALSRAS
jgi:hypothetical protein